MVLLLVAPAKDLVFKDLVEEHRKLQKPLVVVEIGTALGGTGMNIAMSFTIGNHTLPVFEGQYGTMTLAQKDSMPMSSILLKAADSGSKQDCRKVSKTIHKKKTPAVI